MTEPGSRFARGMSAVLSAIELANYVDLDGHILSFPCEYKVIVELSSCGFQFAYTREYSFEPDKNVQFIVYLDLLANYKLFIPLITKTDCHVKIQASRPKGKSQ